MKKQWEYERETIADSTTMGAILSMYGAEGWELVSVIYRESIYLTCIFKRPVIIKE